jgi:hypothetical protein
MNIIELFENASIYRENVTEFTFDDTVKIQKQFEIEKNQNPSIDSNLASNLTIAMKEFPKELFFISSNRILYNFFSKKNHSRNRFSSDAVPVVSVDNVKSFISRFLSNDLDTFFEQKIAENRFDDIEDVLMAKDYLPQNVLDKLNQLVSKKLDAILNKLDNNPSGEDTFSINFIKHRSFYDLLSHFRSVENDDKIKAMLHKSTSSLLSLGIGSEFLDTMKMAMSNYKAVDSNLLSLLKSNKEEAIVRTQKTSSNYSGMSIGTGILVIILVFRLILLMARCSQ